MARRQSSVPKPTLTRARRNGYSASCARTRTVTSVSRALLGAVSTRPMRTCRNSSVRWRFIIPSCRALSEYTCPESIIRVLSTTRLSIACVPPTSTAPLRQQFLDVGPVLERIETDDADRIDDDRPALGDAERDVDVVTAAAQAGVHFRFGEAVDPVQRLEAQHVAPEFHRIERRRFRETEPARERQTIEQRCLRRRDRGAELLVVDGVISLELDFADDGDARHLLRLQLKGKRTCQGYGE